MNSNKWTFILILLMFLSMMAIFLSIGEINLSGLNWLVATNGKKWGLIKINDTETAMGFGVNSGSLMISMWVFLIMVFVLLFFIIINIILFLIKKSEITSFSFLLSSWFIFFAIITSGLLYPAKGNQFQWEILVRLVVILISYPIMFFPINFIIKKFFINTKMGELFMDKLLYQENENAKHINEINKSVIKRKKILKNETIEISDSEI